MKLAIFDIDGTLIKTNEVDEKCFLEAFSEQYGIDIQNQAWHEFRNITEWGIAEEIFENILARKPLAEDYDRLKSLFVRKLKEELQADRSQFEEILGAVDFIKHLQTSVHFEIGIATGSWGQSAEVKLNALSMDYSDIPFSNCDSFISREEITIDAINKARRKYKKEFDEVIYFGDGIWDFRACRNLGIRFIGIDCNQNGILQRFGTRHVFKDYLNKANILEVMHNGG